MRENPKLANLYIFYIANALSHVINAKKSNKTLY